MHRVHLEVAIWKEISEPTTVAVITSGTIEQWERKVLAVWQMANGALRKNA